MKDKIIRCAIYDRVSTEGQVKDGLSLDAQEEALTEYALSHHYKIVDYYSDEGITARKKMQNRKDLIRLLNDVKADKIDLILVTKLDRWFRNIKDYHNTQAILEAHNCNWKTIFEEYDTSTSNGRFAINIMLSVNENECDRDSDRIKNVFEYKKKQREHLNGKPAYGYISVNKKLVKDPETKYIVEDTIEHYFSCYSKKATVKYILSKYANEQNPPTMYQINRILTCETYTGRKYGIDNYCEAYITQEQYKKIVSTSDAKIIPHQTKPFLFSSMIKCPICGKNMSGFVKRQKLKNGNVSEYKRYRCGAKFTAYHNGACISESVIEAYLLDNVMGELNLELLQIKTKEQEEKQKKPASNPVKIMNEINRLNLMYQKGRIDDEYYDKQYAILNEKLSAAQQPQEHRTIENYTSIMETLNDGWYEMYKKLDITHKKAFWKGIIKEIYIDKESRQICGFKFLL